LDEIFERDTVLMNLNTIQRLVYKYVHERTLRGFNVHPGQIPILFLLKRNPGLSQKEIAKIIGVEPGTIAIMLRRMEKAGFVYRVQDEKDRRISRVYPTEKANALIQRLRNILFDVEKLVLTDFTESDKNILRTLLNRMKSNLLSRVQDKPCSSYKGE